jgi:hypothetical protein
MLVPELVIELDTELVAELLWEVVEEAAKATYTEEGYSKNRMGPGVGYTAGHSSGPLFKRYVVSLGQES